MTLPIGSLPLLPEAGAAPQPAPHSPTGFANALATALGGEAVPATTNATLMPTLFAALIPAVPKQGTWRGEPATGAPNGGTATGPRTRAAASPTFPTQQPLTIGASVLAALVHASGQPDGRAEGEAPAVTATGGEAGGSVPADESVIDGGDAQAASLAMPNANAGALAVEAAAVLAAFGVITPATGTVSRGGETIDLRNLVRALREGADPNVVRKDLRELIPEFRSRLEHLIQRMRDEFGYHVEVVEAVRSQPRQDTLFAQGRTAPGPVVTWTRDSQHTLGRAADVMIDGGFTDTRAFERLATLARELGLRTLGARDPGHVELSAQGASETPIVQPTGVQLPAIPSRAAARVGVDRLPAAAMTVVPRAAAAVVPNEGLEPRPLPATANVAAAERVPSPAGLAQPQPVAAVAQVSRVAAVAAPAAVAAVAHVAQVAKVARIARVAAPDAVSGGSEAVRDTPELHVARAAAHPSARHAPTSTTARATDVAASGAIDRTDGSVAPAPTVRGANVPMAPLSIAGDANAERAQEEAANGIGAKRATPNDVRGAAADGEKRAAAVVRAELPPSPALSDGSSHATHGAEGVARTDAAERIARLLQTREHAAERPLSSVVLRLDHPDGGEDRVRVDLRGQSVRATLDIRDAGAAERLSVHAAELTQALERQGLDPQAVTIRAARPVEGSTVAAASAVAERESIRAAATSSAGQGTFTGREQRPNTRPDHDRDGDTPRQRGRRNPQGDR